MGQVSSKLRRHEDGFTWYCPACEGAHPLPDGWTFDGNLESPTFTPSFKHTLVRWSGGVSPEGLGQGERQEIICHYIVTAGRVAYCGDCHHGMKNQTIDMPALPEWLRD